MKHSKSIYCYRSLELSLILAVPVIAAFCFVPSLGVASANRELRSVELDVADTLEEWTYTGHLTKEEIQQVKADFRAYSKLERQAFNDFTKTMNNDIKAINDKDVRRMKQKEFRAAKRDARKRFNSCLRHTKVRALFDHDSSPFVLDPCFSPYFLIL